MSLLKINILRHLVCDVTSSHQDRTRARHGSPRGGVQDHTRGRYYHFRCYNDVISGATFGLITLLRRKTDLLV